MKFPIYQAKAKAVWDVYQPALLMGIQAQNSSHLSCSSATYFLSALKHVGAISPANYIISVLKKHRRRAIGNSSSKVYQLFIELGAHLALTVNQSVSLTDSRFGRTDPVISMNGLVKFTLGGRFVLIWFCLNLGLWTEVTQSKSTRAAFIKPIVYSGLQVASNRNYGRLHPHTVVACIWN